MNAVEKFERAVVRSKGIAPYTVCFAFAVTAVGMFSTAAGFEKAFPLASTTGVWLSILLFGCSIAALIAWHVWQWPAWFDLGKSSEGEQPVVQEAKPRRRSQSSN